jgi:NADPH2:quinone reductase
MRQYQGVGFDFPNDYGTATVPPPRPSAGQVAVRVEATALGYADSLLIRGLYQIKPALPYVPGSEIVGIIEAIGPDVTALEAGQRIASWQLGGGLSEMAIVDAAKAIPVPDGLDAAVAASAILDFQTARYALVERAHLKREEVLLVRGAAGGIGAGAIQFGVALGAHVVAMVSTPEKALEAQRLGAHTVLESDTDGLRERLKTHLPNGTADVIFDPVCGEDFQVYFRSLNKQGRHLVLGFAGGAIPTLPANLPLLKSAALVGADVRHFVDSTPELAQRACKEIFSSLLRGDLQAPKTHLYALDQAQEALTALGNRERIGKVIVLPG